MYVNMCAPSVAPMTRVCAKSRKLCIAMNVLLYYVPSKLCTAVCHVCTVNNNNLLAYVHTYICCAHVCML